MKYEEFSKLVFRAHLQSSELKAHRARHSSRRWLFIPTVDDDIAEHYKAVAV
jgi:hypothetical protein